MLGGCRIIANTENTLSFGSLIVKLWPLSADKDLLNLVDIFCKPFEYVSPVKKIWKQPKIQQLKIELVSWAISSVTLSFYWIFILSTSYNMIRSICCCLYVHEIVWN